MLKYAKAIIEDLYNGYAIVAVLLDIIFFFCKAFEVKILLHLSYAWMLLPALLATLVAHYKRYKASSESKQSNRDVWLLDAIWKAHTGQWGIPNQAAVKGEDQNYWEKLSDKADKIRQYAADGKLPIWGKRQKQWNSLWEPISPEYWLSHTFHPFWFDPNPENLKIMGTEQQQEWKSFMTDKTKVEKLWPKKSFLQALMISTSLLKKNTDKTPHAD